MLDYIVIGIIYGVILCAVGGVIPLLAICAGIATLYKFVFFLVCRWDTRRMRRKQGLNQFTGEPNVQDKTRLHK